MNDPTESNRRALVAEINAHPGSREALEGAGVVLGVSGSAIQERMDLWTSLLPS